MNTNERNALIKTDDGGRVYPEESYYGITRRDWLAGLAMQGFLASPKNPLNSKGEADTSGETIAKISYEQADSMIEKGNE